LATPRAWQDISEGQVPSAGRRPGKGDPHEWAPYSGRQESPQCQLQTNRQAWDAAADLIEQVGVQHSSRPDGARDSLGSFYQGGATPWHCCAEYGVACPSLVYRHALGVAYSVSILQVGQSVSSTLLRYTRLSLSPSGERVGVRGQLESTRIFPQPHAQRVGG